MQLILQKLSLTRFKQDKLENLEYKLCKIKSSEHKVFKIKVQSVKWKSDAFLEMRDGVILSLTAEHQKERDSDSWVNSKFIIFAYSNIVLIFISTWYLHLSNTCMHYHMQVIHMLRASLHQTCSYATRALSSSHPFSFNFFFSLTLIFVIFSIFSLRIIMLSNLFSQIQPSYFCYFRSSHPNIYYFCVQVHIVVSQYFCTQNFRVTLNFQHIKAWLIFNNHMWENCFSSRSIFSLKQIKSLKFCFSIVLLSIFLAIQSLH